ncbi:hypothetical protein [Streptomyces sp. NPDC051183]|uniref:hypothetical protein n=1 Tax=unclassified Streptomyces TaxID=2593676 RepID=UPI003447D433
MPKKRAARLLTAVIIAGFGLTACSQTTTSNSSEGKGGSPSAAASTPAAGSSAQPTPAPSATPSVVVNGKQKPKDLPADLPLPQGELTSVTGTTGAYVLTYTASDSALDAYATALESAGYEVVRTPAAVTGTKAKVNVMVTKTPGTLQVAIAVE